MGHTLVIGYVRNLHRKQNGSTNTVCRLRRAAQLKKTGRKYQLNFRPLVGSDQPVLPADHPIEDPVPIALSAELDQVEYEHPVVKEVVDIFNGRITDIRT